MQPMGFTATVPTTTWEISVKLVSSRFVLFSYAIHTFILISFALECILLTFAIGANRRRNHQRTLSANM